MNVQWADEDRPWLDLRVTSIELNGPVEQDIADARRLLVAASPAPSTRETPRGADQHSAT